MTPVDRASALRPPVPAAAAGDSRLADRGAPYGFAAPGPELPDAAPTRVPGGARRPHLPRPRPGPGWYAYRVRGGAELPPWAVEVALTIERPVTSTLESPLGSPPDFGAAPTGSAGRQDRLRGLGRDTGPGAGGATMPPVPSMVAERWHPSAQEPSAPPAGGAARALLLLRASGRTGWLEGIAEAIAEVEELAGVGTAAPEGAVAEGGRGWRRARLLTGPALPGLAPVTAAVALAHLRVAGSRGLPPPLRRRRPTAGAVEMVWQAGAGSVLTCDGPDGRSAQAAVALRGLANAAAIAPPPGGALVLRAWRARRGWGLACGLVLGAAATAGLGRAAGRAAAIARAEAWDACVLSGPAAMHLARAGSPWLPAPRHVAHAASSTQVASLLQTCLSAGALEGGAAGALQPGSDAMMRP
jgi:hypothetical protein